MARTGYAHTVTDLPLGRLYGLDDEWDSGWGRTQTQLREEVHAACEAQLRLAAS